MASSGVQDSTQLTRAPFHFLSEADELVLGPCIGGGATGTVSRGTWRGAVVAIKEITGVAAGETLRRELDAWLRLNHPHVIHLYCASSPSSPPPFRLVSEYMALGDAKAYLASYPGADRVKLMLDVALGMEYLHLMGVLHGDLKPSNILISDTHSAKITDFGLSRIRDATTVMPSSSTPSNVVSGTAHYLSPECWKGDIHRGRSSDVYAYAVTCYALFTDKAPWQYSPIEAIRALVLGGVRPRRPISRRVVIYGLTNEFWGLITLCWHQTPQKRPAFSEIVKHGAFGGRVIRTNPPSRRTTNDTTTTGGRPDLDFSFQTQFTGLSTPPTPFFPSPLPSSLNILTSPPQVVRKIPSLLSESPLDTPANPRIVQLLPGCSDRRCKVAQLPQSTLAIFETLLTASDAEWVQGSLKDDVVRALLDARVATAISRTMEAASDPTTVLPALRALCRLSTRREHAELLLASYPERHLTTILEVSPMPAPVLAAAARAMGRLAMEQGEAYQILSENPQEFLVQLLEREKTPVVLEQVTYAISRLAQGEEQVNRVLEARPQRPLLRLIDNPDSATPVLSSNVALALGWLAETHNQAKQVLDAHPQGHLIRLVGWGLRSPQAPGHISVIASAAWALGRLAVDSKLAERVLEARVEMDLLRVIKECDHPSAMLALEAAVYAIGRLSQTAGQADRWLAAGVKWPLKRFARRKEESFRPVRQAAVLTLEALQKGYRYRGDVRQLFRWSSWLC